MRLTCPNCAAQYEVDAALVPDGGRDVQCSSCGHAWFQRPDAEAPAIAPPPEPPRKKLDPVVRSILEEEAHREFGGRRTVPGDETPDTAPAPEPEAEPVRDPEPAPTGEPGVAPGPANAATQGPRLRAPAAAARQTPPSERPAAAAPQPAPAPTPAARRGAATGFVAVLVLFALLVVAYVAAPQIAEAIPALDPALSGYVGAVNALRGGIAGLLGG